MELSEAISRRRMARRFTGEPVAPEVLDRMLSLCLDAPSAGFTQGVDLVVLEGAAARGRFWELATDARWRSSGPSADGLLAAPVVVVPVAEPDAYVRRYGEPDKSASGLAGVPARDWDVPYWQVDASFVVMQLLLAAEDSGLGALFFRLHAPSDAVLAGLGAPSRRVTIGAVALGHRAGGERTTSPGRRPRRAVEDSVHRDRW
ncbi:MAG: nitroreductase family protein [Actinomycetota bacterium]|nr:nitroreductase family protein [Actinomycetota bacterium]